MIRLRQARTAMTATALAGVGAAGPAFAQALGQASSADVPWWRVVSALALCLALAVGAALVMKARLRGGPMFANPLFSKAPRRLQAIETLRLSQQLEVHLFNHDGKEVLVAATPHTIAILGETEAAKPAAESE